MQLWTQQIRHRLGPNTFITTDTKNVTRSLTDRHQRGLGFFFLQHRVAQTKTNDNR
jgi:hypothetical protein